MKRSFAFITCLIITLLVIWNKQAAETSQPIERTPTQDLTILMGQSKPLIDNSITPANITAKLGVTYQTYKSISDLETQGAKLCTQFKLPTGMLSEEEGHPTYTCTKQIDPMEITLKVVGMSDNQSYLLVKGTSLHTEGMQPLLQWIDQADHILLGEKIQGKWNFLVKGLQIQDVNTASTVLSQIEDQFQATEVERYADNRSVVISYDTKLLNEVVHSGNKPVKLQVSMHLDSQSNNWFITLGTPMITGEF
ncbi:YwmB family TATA-box binding protein [Paenibacillus sp. N1-5-1-14]|uniref:YwmB family TATA-box binding protein n=1 Tax=Paenibacillus radicibacter TaxID=2972488 RepID=UPI0021596FAB|nr:YwmB family TATA-box binding protein [Paenibacillus radicibacter]MCR8643144.1 YwmB family TATA-box binding protein [Paenibacillus radicibacter]